ncbi:MAG TPA: GGDEF domain-containing protein [Microthrixaceae bacterium]|nr:GGDEF domain-containing protein [Microthrixaceae bacterium]
MSDLDRLVPLALATLGERFDTGVVILDSDLTILWTSPATPSVVGRRTATSVGRSAVELVHPEDIEAVLMVMESAQADPTDVFLRPTGARTIELPVRILADDGSWSQVVAAGRLIDVDGNLVITLRAAAQRVALDQVLNLLGHGDQLEPSLASVVALVTAQFTAEEVCIVHDFDGHAEAVGFATALGDLDPTDMLARLRLSASSDIVDDGVRWVCPVPDRSGRAVLGAIVLATPRPAGPTSFDQTVMGRATSLAAIALEWAQHERRLLVDANMDHLTGVLNRRAFEQRLAERASRNMLPIVSFFVDIDCFKSINDTHGHAVGDEILIAVAKRLDRAVRSVDMVGRLGGDEFVVACPAMALGDAPGAAQRFRGVVEHPVRTSAGLIDVEVSVGSAAATDADEVASLLDRSDAAMYRDKAARRGARAEVSSAPMGS